MKKILALICLLLPFTASAIGVGDADLPNSWTVSGQRLVLNGAGLREYSAFKVDVYAAALYLKAKQSNENVILDGAGTKVVHMVYFEDVSEEDTRKAWAGYIRMNCKAEGESCKLKESSLQRFLSLIPESEEDDEQTYIFDSNGLALIFNGERVGRVDDPAFARLVLATWIGMVPSTQELKMDLLGR